MVIDSEFSCVHIRLSLCDQWFCHYANSHQSLAGLK